MSYLLVYGVLICTLVLIREWGQKSTIDQFLVADRKVGGFVGSMSIAASWIWAPAIFISSQTGYMWGLSGLVWFVLPNLLALVIFAPLAKKVRRALPQGYSYVEYISRGHRSFTVAQITIQLVMQVIIFAIQLVAGAELLSLVTGAAYHWMVIGMALTPLCYSLFSGLRTSIFTDAIQYAIIAVSLFAILLSFPSYPIKFDTRPFNPLAHSLLFEFGISSALGLIVAIFADHQQWQRAFAIKSEEVAATFYKAALLHGAVTLSLGIFGIRIFSVGFKPDRIDLVGIEFISANYSPIFISVFVVMAMCALISTLDSALCAFSSLATKELSRNVASLNRGRRWMIILVIGAISIALLRPRLVTFWFLASTIRLSSFLPTIICIIRGTAPTIAYTVALCAAFLIGGTVFASGIYFEDSITRTIGMVLTLLISALVLSFAKLMECRGVHRSITSDMKHL